MARMKKEDVIKSLKELGVSFDIKGKYNDLCKLLKEAVKSKPNENLGNIPVLPAKPKQIKFINKIRKRNAYLADSSRNEKDAEALRMEVRKLGHKPNIKAITTVKNYEVDDDGNYVTEFTIDLKE